MNVSKKKILQYTLLPEFIPRIRELFGSGFYHVAIMIAVLFGSVGLLPRDHPYLQAKNFGKFSIRQAIAQAGSNLKYDLKHIDQVILFYTILLGLILIFFQVLVFTISMLVNPAIAGIGDFFLTPSQFTNAGPAQDIAMILLDRIFGTIGIFDSCISTSEICVDNQGNNISSDFSYPYPLHIALHQILLYYSMGISVVASIIILYYITTIVAETSVTGTPFGARVNKAWALPRLIVFFALLAPVTLSGPNAGLNAAQLITLYTAKFGSNLATNGWAGFNTVLTNSYLGDVSGLIARPNIPEVDELVQYMYIAKVCQITEGVLPPGQEVKLYAVRGNAFNEPPNYIDLIDSTPNYQELVNFSKGGNIILRFGVHDEKKNKLLDGNVKPVCGEMKLHVTDLHEPGSIAIQEAYYHLITSLWIDDVIEDYASCFARRNLPIDIDLSCTKIPDEELARDRQQHYTEFVKEKVDQYLQEQVDSGNWNVSEDLEDKGWAGAAIWYNRIAKMNGAVTTAILAIPKPQRFPMSMEAVLLQRKTEDNDITGVERFNPALPKKRLANLSERDLLSANVLYKSTKIWANDNIGKSIKSKKTGNSFIDTVNLLLGTSGIFEIRRNHDVHPLAQMSSLGKALIEATVRNALIALGGSIAGGMDGILGQFISGLGKSATSFFFTLAAATLTMGIILFYVLPFLPFVFFIFAVSGWIKSIFEAIVAMPLWALAHLQLDGEGLPGRSAANGYYLLLEILLRPIMVLFGLLASLSIYAALVSVLNQIFDLVIANVGGYDVQCDFDLTACMDTTQDVTSIEYYRSPIDQFFFTAMYSILVYIIGLSCFKLIDQIPTSILRWIGTNVKTFQEDAGDPASQLTSKVYKGSQISVQQALGGSRLSQFLIASS